MTVTTGSVLRGAIICESLRPGTVLEGYDIRVSRWARYDVPGAAEWQASTWTLIEFEAPSEASEGLAGDLSASLLDRGWYANWNTDEEATVVFSGRIFRYPRGDEAGREEAQAHGRACGVPEPQLDWGD